MATTAAAISALLDIRPAGADSRKRDGDVVGMRFSRSKGQVFPSRDRRVAGVGFSGSERPPARLPVPASSRATALARAPPLGTGWPGLPFRDMPKACRSPPGEAAGIPSRWRITEAWRSRSANLRRLPAAVPPDANLLPRHLRLESQRPEKGQREFAVSAPPVVSVARSSRRLACRISPRKRGQGYLTTLKPPFMDDACGSHTYVYLPALRVTVHFVFWTFRTLVALLTPGPFRRKLW